MSKPIAVVILEVMWDWEARTSIAGYEQRAPRSFQINPRNFTGRRLHAWLKDYEFRVTNACPQLVNSAKGRGTPDKQWVKENLTLLAPFSLLLVCGKVAQATYDAADAQSARIIEMPHPAARGWTTAGLAAVPQAIQNSASLRIALNGTITELP